MSSIQFGIDFDEAQTLWQDERRIVLPSPADAGEIRWLVIGRIDDIGWTAIVTMRDSATRIISVRRARKQELELYGH